MRPFLKETTNVLAVMAMLGLGLAVPAPVPPPNPSRYSQPQAIPLNPSSLNPATTVTMLMDKMLGTPTKARRQLVVPTDIFATISTLPDIEGVPSVSPDDAPTPLSATTLSTISIAPTDSDTMTSSSTSTLSVPSTLTTITVPTTDLPISHSTSDILNSTTPSIPSLNLFQNRTCGSSALIALYKWRDVCDRDPFSHMNPNCLNRAPSVDRCCDDPNDPADRDWIREGAPGSCSKYWPKDGEEGMCTEDISAKACDCVNVRCN